MKDLKEFAKNVYSQNGEDGIIEEILRRLNIENGNCCELGAWDGIKFSNTYNLVEKKDWYAIYIESDEEKYKELLITAEQYINKNPPPTKFFDGMKPYRENYIYAINAKVTDNLDIALIMGRMLPDFDILSIDVDGEDYYIWEHVGTKERLFYPKIVIIEVNSSVPPPIEQTHDSEHQGSSFTSMLKLGNEKGYDLVCHTGNMIFVRKDLTGDLFENMNSDSLFTDKWVAK